MCCKPARSLLFCDFYFLFIEYIFANFDAYVPVRSKVMNILSHLPDSCQIFTIFVKTPQYQTAATRDDVKSVCLNIFHQAINCMMT